MPNMVNRSPERDQRSVGYDREAEWRRFQEWEKQNKKSPLRGSPRRSPPRLLNRSSPRREHGSVQPPPPAWARRSPPRNFRPPEWGRRSPPPAWGGRSPPRYGASSRGRSPPRSNSPPRWGPRPQEWDRYHAFPPRRSPPRWPQPPPWEARRDPYIPPPRQYGKWAPPPTEKHFPRRGGPPSGTAPATPQKIETKKIAPEPLKSEDGSGEDEILENFDLPEYDPDQPLGQKYVIAVSGFFCKICHKFYNSESSAKITHCKSKTHYDKFSKWVSDRKDEALAQKNAAPPTAPTPVPPVLISSVPSTEELSEGTPEEPPTKVAKLESDEPPAQQNQEDFSADLHVKEEIQEDSEGDASNGKYDPSEPTAEEGTPQAVKVEEQEANLSASNSDADKGHVSDGDFSEATLYNFRKMRVNQLKENLKKRGLAIHGLKPLLLKRLEKALLAEAVEAENNQENKKEGQEEEEPKSSLTERPAEERAGVGGDTEAASQLTLTMMESDIETANKKTQWITERELERELMQLNESTEVLGMDRKETKMGKKTVVEWTIRVSYKGDFPADGLDFWMESHQQLPYRATLAE